MREQLLTLLEIQKLDRQLDDLRSGLAELEEARELAGLREEVESARERVNGIRNRLQALSKDVRWLEQESDALCAKWQEMEGTMYSGKVKSAKELEQMQEKVAELKKEQAHLEDRALNGMEEIERLTERQAEEARRLKALEAQLAAAEEEHRKEVGRVRDIVAEVSSKREALASVVSERILAEYDRLRERRGGVAVAEMKDGLCTGCSVSLSHLLIEQVRRGEGAYKCESCGRFLCYRGD